MSIDSQIKKTAQELRMVLRVHMASISNSEHHSIYSNMIINKCISIIKLVCNEGFAVSM